MRLGMDCGYQAGDAYEYVDEGPSQHLDIMSPTGAVHSIDSILSHNIF